MGGAATTLRTRASGVFGPPATASACANGGKSTPPPPPDAYNLALDTDSYKVSHWLQYPPKTTRVFSYIESRGGRHPSTVFFGLQYMIKKQLCRAVTRAEVERAAELWTAHGLPFNKAGWLHVVDAHAGLLPLRVRAVPEGTVVPTGNVLVTVENTCDECFWCTSWVETSMLRVWYPITVATESRHIKSILKGALERSSDDDGREELDFKLHDFGARGVSSQESAAWGGAAHLVNFRGTDTFVAAVLLMRYYGATAMPGVSIPAAEHSTVTAWSRTGEEDAYRNMVRRFARPGSLYAVVSDSYDIHAAVRDLWGTRLRDEDVAAGGTLVVRPDSGVPHEIVLEVLRLLDEKFGSTVNSKGFKVLNTVRVIQGDGVDASSIEKILATALEAGFSATNVAFGMGGALLQKHHRDVQKFAMKCSYVRTDGRDVDVYKDPVTDPGKRSKRGRLDLVRSARGEFETRVIPPGIDALPDSALVTVYENGALLRDFSLDEVRRNASVW